MRRLQTIGNLHAARKHQLHICRTLGNHLVQALARDVLHDNVGLFVFLTYLVDSADIRVVDRRRQPRLSQLGHPHLLGSLHPALQQLQNHRPL